MKTTTLYHSDLKRLFNEKREYIKHKEARRVGMAALIVIIGTFSIYCLAAF